MNHLSSVFPVAVWQELGGYPEDIFEAMGDTPVAAASLGQVHMHVCFLSTTLRSVRYGRAPCNKTRRQLLLLSPPACLK